MGAEGIDPLQRDRTFDHTIEGKALHADRRAKLELGAMVDHSLGWRDHLPIVGRAAAIRINIDRALPDAAWCHVLDLLVFPIVLKLMNIGLLPLIGALARPEVVVDGHGEAQDFFRSIETTFVVLVFDLGDKTRRDFAIRCFSRAS